LPITRHNGAIIATPTWFVKDDSSEALMRVACEGRFLRANYALPGQPLPEFGSGAQQRRR
jgi:hypothetical protein